MPESQSNLATEGKSTGWLTWTGRAVLVLGAWYLIHLVPEPMPATPAGAGKSAFQWEREAFWQQLENQFVLQRAAGCESLDQVIQASLKNLGSQLNLLAQTNLPAEAELFDAIETNFFTLAPMIGACSDRLPEYLATYTAMRAALKRQSQHWSTDSQTVRERLYRSLYGGRAAIEEVMLQAPREEIKPLMLGTDEPSATPGAEVRGLVLHSGDILVSRGGAATSALIARGNDFSGNFSHVALVHVDETTRAVSVIESHIESGVGVFPIEHYLGQTMLRIMVLRPRADLPALVADPQLPHKAATQALQDAQRRHIPYDFAMDCADPSKQFCSEVAAVAYQSQGVRLWMGMSHLSSPGLTAWLSSMGVRHFETQEPADLEYDPQLCVVAEWRDRETLLKDHVDNAVIDALLEGAEAGEPLHYNRWLLPFARTLKAWCVVKNQFSSVGAIPEGMSATTALRVDQFTQRHDRIAAAVLARIEPFREERGYLPPYWELVRLAREAADE
jgi:hypothetical protein